MGIFKGLRQFIFVNCHVEKKRSRIKENRSSILITAEMAYITSDGRVLESRPFGLSSITDLFWGFINFFMLFFRTLINPQANSKGEGYSTDYRSTGGRGPPPGGGPRRRINGFGGSGGAAAPPPPRGGG